MTRELIVALPRYKDTIGMREIVVGRPMTGTSMTADLLSYMTTRNALDAWMRDDEAHRSVLWDDHGCTIGYLAEHGVVLRRLNKLRDNGDVVYRVSDLTGLHLPDVSFIVREQLADGEALNQIAQLVKDHPVTTWPDHLAPVVAKAEDILRATGRLR